MMAASAEEIARGELLTHEEVLAQLAALRAKA
jgi:predicted transcriptional regulator